MIQGLTAGRQRGAADGGERERPARPDRGHQLGPGQSAVFSHQDVPSQGCAAAGFYGVYGDVSALRGWVDSTIAGNFGADFCPAGPEPDTV